MTNQGFKMLGFCTLLLATQLFAWGCSPIQNESATTKSVPDRVCDGGMMDRVAELAPHTVGTFLESAEEEGGVACWSEAMQSALRKGKPIPQDQLVKALDAFNRNSTAGDFHRAVGQYLRGLAENDGPYTKADHHLLEAYSRYVIRMAHSQDDANLQLAQMACARLDRELHARLFE